MFKLLACAHLGEFHLSITHRCCEFLRSLRHIDAQFRLLRFDKFGELSHGAVDVEREHLFLHRRFEFRKGSFSFEIGLCLAVIVIESRLCAAFRINLKDAEVFLDFRWCVVGICHGDDGISFHQDGEFPERSIKVVDDASASIDVASEVVHPISFGKVDSIAAVVAFCVSCRVLIDGSHKEGVTIHELILCALTKCVGIAFFHEHGANHGLTIHSFSGCSVGIREKFALEFEIPAVECGALATECVRIFGIGTPTIHVQLHGSEGFPLIFAHIHGNVLTSEDTIHVRSDVGLSRQTSTDECWDVKTDIFPIATSLVAAPDSRIALSSCPSIERDDEGACVVAIFRHDATHIGYTVESEAITPAHPGYVGFEHAHTSGADFFHNVALQESFDAVFGVKVALCPQTDFHTFAASVVAKLTEVFNVAIERFRLSVTRTISIVGEEPTQGHIIIEIAVDGCAS